jgi:hypothetical protein
MPRADLHEQLAALPSPVLDVEAELETVRTRAKRARRRRLGVAVAVAIALVGVGIVASRSGDDDARRSVVAEPSPTQSTLLPRHLPKLADSATTRFNLPDGIGGPILALGDGSVWVGSTLPSAPPQCHVTCGAVARLDPRTGHVTATIPVPKAPRALAYGYGALWAEVEVPDDSPALVVKIDPTTNQVVAQVEIPDIIVVGSTGHPRLAVGAAAVWASYGVSLTKFDPATGQVVGNARLGDSDRGVIADKSGVWLVGATILAVDPTTLAAHDLANLPLGFVQSAGVEGDTIWLTEAHGPAVPRSSMPTFELFAVDTQTGQVRGTSHPTTFVVAGGGQVWFQAMEALVEVDPRTGQELRQAPVGVDTSIETTGAVDRHTVWLLRNHQLIRIRT